MADSNGVLITEVIHNSPAERAGIKTGDILISIDNNAINDWNSMLETVANLPPGNVVAVKVLRKGTAIVSQVKIGKRPKSRA